MRESRAAAGKPANLDAVAAYYSARVREHGATPFGVDWPSREAQDLRFTQLLRICEWASPFSLNDLGCGYGALADHIRSRRPEAVVDYCGIDISAAMVEAARQRLGAAAQLEVGRSSSRMADYSVASGIFNVRLGHSLKAWKGSIARTLDDLFATSRRGFAVNFIAPGPEPAPRGIFRGEPDEWVRYCAAQAGARVEFVGHYGLDEYTLLVRKPWSMPPPR